jgi:hypothetical protein
MNQRASFCGKKARLDKQLLGGLRHQPICIQRQEKVFGVAFATEMPNLPCYSHSCKITRGKEVCGNAEARDLWW